MELVDRGECHAFAVLPVVCLFGLETAELLCPHEGDGRSMWWSEWDH